MGIVTLTLNPAVDTSTSVDQVVSDRKLRCAMVRCEAGGGGLNVSRAIAHLGGTSVALYASGGPMGQRLEGLLGQEGLNHQPLRIEAETRENFVITEVSTNRQYRFVMPGPTFQQAEWEQFLEAVLRFPRPDFLVASGSLPPGVPQDFYARVIQAGKKRGIRVLVDTSGEPLRQAASEGAFLLKPNLPELETLAASSLSGEAELEQAARALVEQMKNEVVVLSLGAAGALLVTAELQVRLQVPSVRIQSRVGAGDSMMAGTVLKLAQGWPVEDAVRYGVAAGTAAVMNPGTKLCRLDDTEALYQQYLARKTLEP